MLFKNHHLSDDDLIHSSNGEYPARRRAEVSAHLETCWACRERMLSLQNTIADFVRARNEELSEQFQPAAGPRALLRARLTEAASTPAVPVSLPAATVPWMAPGVFRLFPAGVAFVSVLVAIIIGFQVTVSAEGPKPRSGVTPGETRPVTLAEVCHSPQAEVVAPDVPEAVQKQVFAAYGIKSPRPGQFEVDYLITPDLGGTNSVRNLWPQAYSARWNARTKDKLEQKLHQLVCDGKLDLVTAQHDIAVDWIGAYKKYVGANRVQ